MRDQLVDSPAKGDDRNGDRNAAEDRRLAANRMAWQPFDRLLSALDLKSKFL